MTAHEQLVAARNLIADEDGWVAACPDDGTCHHECADYPGGHCWRVHNAGPLSGVYPDDRWPKGARAVFSRSPVGEGHAPFVDSPTIHRTINERAVGEEEKRDGRRGLRLPDSGLLGRLAPKGRRAAETARPALEAAHDPALGLERSVRLGDVVEAFRTRATEVESRDEIAALVARFAADFIELGEQGEGVHCDRCGVPLKVNPDRNENARLLRHSLTAGVCANCAVTAFLKGMEPLATILATRGPAILLNPAAQAQFGAALKAGGADADSAEIDWQTVVEQWDKS